MVNPSKAGCGNPRQEQRSRSQTTLARFQKTEKQPVNQLYILCTMKSLSGKENCLLASDIKIKKTSCEYG